MAALTFFFFFCLEKLEVDYDGFFPPLYFLAIISTNQLKDEFFADRQKNFTCKLEYGYFDMALSKIFLFSGQQIKKKFQKKFFSLNAGPLPPLFIALPVIKELFFAASLSCYGVLVTCIIYVLRDTLL